ncbi:MAG: leucine-rich repeat domain-containing protein, partial [Ruminococcus sp.]
ADFKRVSTKTVKLELPIFGGCFRGEKYNFIVCGQRNDSQDNSAEVIRVIKYDRQWKRLGSVSVKNINTVEPFRAGTLRMTETGGTLFLHTSHLMYKSSDGYNHQANMTLAVDENSMVLTQQFSRVWNISGGYVSHSFNQFVLTDGSSLYRLDHGDAYPRSVVLTKAPISSIASSSNTNILKIAGNTGDNDTGVSVGGFSMAGGRLLAAGNSVDQNKATFDAYGRRNIFVTSTDTGLSKTRTVWLTGYGADSDITVRTPQLVKTGEDSLYVLWEEYRSSTGKTAVRIAEIDAGGNVKAGPYTLKARLSDCQPICTQAGHIVWEVSKTGSITFYDLDPSKLAEYEKETLTALPKTGSAVKVSGVTYKVTKSSRTEGTVTYMAPKTGTVQSVTVPSTVKIGGISFKVTAIGNKAFYGMKNLKQVTVGSNVTSIGTGAFRNCSSLKSITIRSSKLDNIGTQAVKGIYAKAIIRCPSAKVTAYKKLFTSGTGFVKTMKINKI